MKKQFLALLLAAPACVYAQTPVPFTIKGKLGPQPAAAKVYLVRGMSVTDSAAVRNGAFEMNGTTNAPSMAMLVFRRNGRMASLRGQEFDRANLYLESGTTVVSSPDSLAHATIAGGALNKDFARLKTAIAPVIAQIQAYGAELQAATEQQRQDPAFGEKIQARFAEFNKQFAAANYAFVKANPNSLVSLDALLEVQGRDLPQYATVGPLYEALSPVLKNTPQGQEYGKLVQGLKTVAIGVQAPDFTQQTPNGKTVSLRDYRGKYVLIDFWASWCGPCRQENPNVAKAYAAYKGRNFEVLGVSLDDEKQRDKWVKAIADDQMTWTQVSDLKGWENAAARSYAVSGIPQNYLIDPTGKIIAANLKGADLQATLAKYIK